MAIATAGITVTWDSTALGDITEIKWKQGDGLPQSRGSSAANTKPWTFAAGTVEISSLSTSAGAIGQYGRKATLAIGGTARSHSATATVITVNLSTKAICQTLDLGAKVNDAWRYKGTFKIVME